LSTLRMLAANRIRLSVAVAAAVFAIGAAPVGADSVTKHGRGGASKAEIHQMTLEWSKMVMDEYEGPNVVHPARWLGGVCGQLTEYARKRYTQKVLGPAAASSQCGTVFNTAFRKEAKVFQSEVSYWLIQKMRINTVIYGRSFHYKGWLFATATPRGNWLTRTTLVRDGSRWLFDSVLPLPAKRS
jgi:hypothetical protein